MSLKRKQTKIVNGVIIDVDKNDADTTTTTLVSQQSTIDVFGFMLSWRQFIITLVLISIMMGPSGSKYMPRVDDMSRSLLLFCAAARRPTKTDSSVV
jgi:hypothetical protein